MKRILTVALTIVLAVSLTTTAFAGTGKDENKATFDMATVEANLIAGVQSENFGLRTSAATMLGDLKCPNGVLALMSVLRNDTDERARIVAALALTKIGDPVGMYAVKQTARLDSNERVKKLCGLFYQERKQQEIS